MIVVDIEVFIDYFLISFKQIKTGKLRHFELFEGNPLNIKEIKKIMEKKTTISFNGLSYDLPLITAALKGWTAGRLKYFSDDIIKSNKPSWIIAQESHIKTPAKWDHIDLIEVAPGKASLKIYGGRMHALKIQDLPFEPSEHITPGLRNIIK